MADETGPQDALTGVYKHPTTGAFERRKIRTTDGGEPLVVRPTDISGTGVFGEQADISTTRVEIDLSANPVAVFSWQWFANASETIRWAYVVINADDDTDADNKLASASARRVIALGAAAGLPTSGVFTSDSLATADLISRIDIKAATATAGSGNDFFYEGVVP
jgi:hypothetical protein